MLKKKKGMALITVIMVLLVLSILGTTLLSISLSETKGSLNNEKKMQAYYIAKSGADAVAAWIDAHSGEASDIIPEIGEYTSDEVSFGEGVFSVKLTRDTIDSTVIKIESTSTLNNGGINGKATLTIQESGGYTGEEIFTEVLFGKNISLNGNAKITGDIEVVNKIDIKKMKNIDGIITEGSKKSFPEPVFPNLSQRVYDKSGISIDGEYIIPSNSDLIFNTAKNQILRVIVDSLDIKNLTINGEGIVFLFLKSNVKISGNVNINGNNKKENGNSDPNSLFIFLKEGSNFEFTGNAEINGFIYAPNASFYMKGSTEFTGSIIGGEATFSGSTDAVYKNPKMSIANSVVTYIGTSYKRLNWSNNQ